VEELNFGASRGSPAQSAASIQEGNASKPGSLAPRPQLLAVPNRPESHLGSAGARWREPDGVGTVLLEGWAPPASVALSPSGKGRREAGEQ
jgi:hypothetical protein